jgi:general secretion pathway protein I
MNKHAGFGLLEAIVAMTLIAGIGMSLFSWINSNMIALQRVEAARVRNIAIENSIEYMQSINPMLRPEGKIKLGNLDLNWHSEPKSDAMDIKDFGLYKVALYNVTVSGSDSANPNWFSFKMVLVAYKKVRNNATQLLFTQ